jgi:hypothetical protein
VLEALYCVAPWCLQRGLQAKRERRPSLQVPEVYRIEASANIVVKAESVRVCVVRRPPAARGLPFLLYAKEEAVYRRAAMFYLCVEAWRSVPWNRRPSWRILLPVGHHDVSCIRPRTASRVEV